MSISRWNRRTLLSVGAGGGAIAGAAALPRLLAQETATPTSPMDDMATLTTGHEGHSQSSTVGDVDIERLGWDPSEFGSTFDYGETTTMRDGTVVREWKIGAGE